MKRRSPHGRDPPLFLCLSLSLENPRATAKRDKRYSNRVRLRQSRVNPARHPCKLLSAHVVEDKSLIRRVRDSHRDPKLSVTQGILVSGPGVFRLARDRSVVPDVIEFHRVLLGIRSCLISPLLNKIYYEAEIFAGYGGSIVIGKCISRVFLAARKLRCCRIYDS